MTSSLTHRQETFQNKCLHNIMNIFGPNTINNQDLPQRINCLPLATVVKRRHCMWIGHVCHVPPTDRTRIALHWTPDGKQSRGYLKETCRCYIEKKMKVDGLTWNISKLAKTKVDGNLKQKPHVPPRHRGGLRVQFTMLM